MRILALDYGDKRIGAAVCDELGIAAHGLTTIIRKNTESDIDKISELVTNLGVEKIVVGYHIRIDGSEGRQCEKVNGFISKLETHFSIPIVRWDEAFSTKDAEDVMRGNNRRRDKQKKNRIDRIAASIILQSYLNFKTSKTID